MSESETWYIARAFDGNRWVGRIEVPSLDDAIRQARGLMDIIANGNEPAWLLIEVAATDAVGKIERQWVECGSGYKAVLGRDGKS